MFKDALLLGQKEVSIALETSKGTAIANVVEVEKVPEHCAYKYACFVKEFGKDWVERKPATGRYNCAGHVWASRRTSILDPKLYEVIINDDGYRPINCNEVLAGDIVVYADLNEGGEILHVGRVYAYKIGPGNSRIPWVISKWNSTCGESLHMAFDVPYEKQGFRLEVKFFTDRPAFSQGIA